MRGVPVVRCQRPRLGSGRNGPCRCGLRAQTPQGLATATAWRSTMVVPAAQFAIKSWKPTIFEQTLISMELLLVTGRLLVANGYNDS